MLISVEKTNCNDRQNYVVERCIFIIIDTCPIIVMGEYRLNSSLTNLPPWIERVTKTASDSSLRWAALKVETLGLGTRIKVGISV